MGVPTSEVRYTLATAGRGEHKVHKGHVVALGSKELYHGVTHVCQYSVVGIVICYGLVSLVIEFW
jgi:hypothetical protein